MDCKTLTLLELQHACCYPLDSSLLPELYAALIRNCLLETITLEAPGKAELTIYLMHLCVESRVPTEMFGAHFA